eukprot:gene258-3634_t
MLTAYSPLSFYSKRRLPTLSIGQTVPANGSVQKEKYINPSTPGSFHTPQSAKIVSRKEPMLHKTLFRNAAATYRGHHNVCALAGVVCNTWGPGAVATAAVGAPVVRQSHCSLHHGHAYPALAAQGSP